MPRLTQDALKIALAATPTASSCAALLSLVTIAAIVAPPGSAMTTSVSTAPVCRRAIWLANWLRAARRQPRTAGAIAAGGSFHQRHAGQIVHRIDRVQGRLVTDLVPGSIGECGLLSKVPGSIGE